MEISKGASYQTEYSPHTQITIDTDPMGLQVIQKFNMFGKCIFLEKQTKDNKILLQTIYTYDKNQNLKKQTITCKDRTCTTLWDYDNRDRVIKYIEGADSPDEKITTSTYHLNGAIATLTKPSGLILSYDYDVLSRLERQFSSDGSIDYRYVYDKTGCILTIQDNNTKQQLTRLYDDERRPKEEILPTGLSVLWNYDAMGRRSSLTLPDGSFITYKYKGLYLEKISRHTKNGDCLYTHHYLNRDLSGNILHEKLPVSSGTLLRHFDKIGRVTSVTSPYFSHEALHFDLVGNLRDSKRQEKHLSYDYDSSYQLSEEKEEETALHHYTYDALNNRIQKDESTYESNSLNQTSVTPYTIDGNINSFADKKFTYDALDRLILVETESQKVVYSYDALDRRLTKQVYNYEERWNLSDTFYYLYDGQNEIGTIDNTGTITELRILGVTPKAEIGAAIALELQGHLHIPLYDLQGSLAVLYDPTQGTVEHYEYTAFGEELFSENAVSSPWRYASKRTDPETQFVYFGRRYYIPSLGRWLTPDPSGLIAGPNLYAYVSNGPLTRCDLYGLVEVISSSDLHELRTSTDNSYWDLIAKNSLSTKSAIPAYDSPEGAFRGRTEPGSFIYTISGREQTHGTIIFINGILTPYEEAREYARSLSEEAGGVRVIGIYKKTNGPVKDTLNCILGIAGIGNDSTELLQGEIKRYFNFYSTSPKDVALLVGHSGGCIDINNSLQRSHPDIRQRCEVLAIAPGMIVSQEYCANASNYASTRDFVTIAGQILKSGLDLVNALGNASGRPDDPWEISMHNKDPFQSIRAFKELQRLPSHPNAPLHDHSYQSPTTKPKATDYVEDYISRMHGIK